MQHGECHLSLFPFPLLITPPPPSNDAYRNQKCLDRQGKH
ncbi:hypothetical protein Nmel_007738 [Mimus melanotis]